MLKPSADLSFLYQHLPFLDRFRGIRLHRKDLSLAVDAAKALDLSLPNAAVTQQLMNTAIATGDGDKDHSGLIRTLEALAGDQP